MKRPRDEDWAWGYVSRLLSFRPRTEAELRSRLALKGCEEKLIDRVIARAKAEGLVDDRLFARLYAEDRLLGRPCSRGMLARELRAKGVSREVAERAAAEVLPELDERALAERALEGRLSLWQGLPDEVRKRRAYAFLLRRGFSPELARELVEEIVGGGDG
ncbi:regulatory protein RecX [Candidatus Bipolaricaulota bacterium]|nr:regulatory protein RecX [Candidatus Bipolaricaulota bacterium]